MGRSDRRIFLKKAAASAGSLVLFNALPESIRKAMAIPACSKSGTLDDVEHIVVLMQENRSFDHYLGHLGGVRGYNDRFPIRLTSQRPVWFQTRNDVSRGAIAPFHLNTQTTSAQCMGDLDHSWHKTHAAFNNGRYDAWPRHKTDMTMGFYLRADIPFHYALADAFTVCDHYFCSLPGPTHPNRMFLMTGTIDPSGRGGGPLIDNRDAVLKPELPAFTWTTYPERLEKAGISWQVYQEGTNFRDNYSGNFGLNVLASFKNFIDAPEGSALRRKAMTARSLTQLADDTRRNELPRVSWLLPPAAFSEHPKWTPAYGANYVARVLDALTANPLVWSKTVLFVLYDENDGFFDHIPPPQPPANSGQGKSTVAVRDELHTIVNPLHDPVYEADGLPYGLGSRVPMTVISPWSKGGFVCSQVFDHTSVIRFIERRFGVVEPNISAWRRAVCGDLSAALDFSRCDQTIPVLPDTGDYRALADKQCSVLLKPSAPAGEVSAFQAQEPGIRPARPLPYDLHVRASLDIRDKRLRVQFENQGKQGAHFWAYADDPRFSPRRYTVEAGKLLSDDFPAAPLGNYAWTVYGPNGFVRMMKGVISPAGFSDTALLGMEAHYDRRKDVLLVEVRNQGVKALSLRLTDAVYDNPEQAIALAPESAHQFIWEVKDCGHWYDATLVVAEYPDYIRRFSGHIETGRASCTDPAAHAPVLA
ncbi:MAG: phospholipase C, phosphocholine-specific [Burkholderiaceae bacterium]